MSNSTSFSARKLAARFAPWARPALAVGALLLPVAVLITGCGAGSGGDNSPSPTPTPTPTSTPFPLNTAIPSITPNATPDPTLDLTRANITFSNTGSTSANTAPINLSSVVSNVTSTSNGVHAGLSAFAAFTEFHILALDKTSGSRARTLDLELRPDTRAEATNPVPGTVYTFTPTDLGVFSRLTKLYLVDGNSIFIANSGTATITSVTNTAYSVRLDNVQMMLFDPVNGPVATDTFTLQGTARIQKSNIVIEPQIEYRNHQFGIVGTSALTSSSAFRKAISKR